MLFQLPSVYAFLLKLAVHCNFPVHVRHSRDTHSACVTAAVLLRLQVLLPFTFNQGAIDAISGTQPPQPANVTAPTVASGNVTETPTTLNVSASQGPPTPAPGGRRLLDLP